MQCNIDARGKAVRLMMGAVMLVAALVVSGLIVWGLLPGGWVWALVAVMVLLGVAGVIEGRAGWCVARAMGFRTPI